MANVQFKMRIKDKNMKSYVNISLIKFLLLWYYVDMILFQFRLCHGYPQLTTQLKSFQV